MKTIEWIKMDWQMEGWMDGWMIEYSEQIDGYDTVHKKQVCVCKYGLKNRQKDDTVQTLTHNNSALRSI